MEVNSIGATARSREGIDERLQDRYSDRILMKRTVPKYLIAVAGVALSFLAAAQVGQQREFAERHPSSRCVATCKRGGVGGTAVAAAVSFPHLRR